MNSESRPYLSVIVPTIARASRKLDVSLQALAELEYPSDCFEVIIVDDGSDSPPKGLVQRFRHHLRIILLQQHHQGPGTARNLAAKSARGKYLAFTDDDCAPARDWLMRLAEIFAQYPEHGIGGRTENALTDNPYSEATQSLISCLYRYYGNDDKPGRFFTANNLALPRERFLEIGGFDSSIPFAAGDRNICDRWRLHGYELTYAPEVIVYHYHSLSLLSFCRQHFTYGRGAYHFHRIRDDRGQKRIEVKPIGFYLDMVKHPFSRLGFRRALFVALLLIISQGMNAAGYLWQRVIHNAHEKGSGSVAN